MAASHLVYSERSPPADLTPWIVCFWQIVGEVMPGQPLEHRILPDGCADIIFDLELARKSLQPSGEFICPASVAVVVALEGRIDYLGVRFRPGVVGLLADIQERPLTASAVQLASVSNAARFALLTAACRERAVKLACPDPLVQWAIGFWYEKSPDHCDHVATVARAVALSERAFERRFLSQVGLRPVEFRRLARFRSVLRRHGAGMCNWSELAALQGYSDQAHLVREFQRFSGLTPTAWERAQHLHAGFVQDSQVATV